MAFKPLVVCKVGLIILLIGSSGIIIKFYIQLDSLRKYVEIGVDSCISRTKVAFAKTQDSRLAAPHCRIFSSGILLMFIPFHKGTCTSCSIRFVCELVLRFAIPETDWVFPLNEPFDTSMISNFHWATMELDLFLFHRYFCKFSLRLFCFDKACLHKNVNKKLKYFLTILSLSNMSLDMTLTSDMTMVMTLYRNGIGGDICITSDMASNMTSVITGMWLN